MYICVDIPIYIEFGLTALARKASQQDGGNQSSFWDLNLYIDIDIYRYIYRYRYRYI